MIRFGCSGGKVVGEAHATICCNGNLSLPPSDRGRLGWGWLCGFRVKANSYSPKSRPLPSPLPPDGRGGRFQVKTRSSENLEIRVCRETRSTPVFRRPFPIPYPQAPFYLSNPTEKAYNPTFIFEFIIFSDDLRQRKEVV